MCLRLSGELYSPVAGRAGLRHRRDAVHRSGGVCGLRRLRERLPGGRYRPRCSADVRTAAVHRAQRGVLSGPPGRREAAADIQTGAGDSGARGPRQSRRSADGGHRGFWTGRDVRRRRTAHSTRRAGQRLRKAARPLRIGARRGRPRSPDHQAGDAAFRSDRASSRIPVLSQCRDRQASKPRRLAGASPRGHLRIGRAQRPPAGHRRDGSARHRHRHRVGGLDQRPPRFR